MGGLKKPLHYKEADPEKQATFREEIKSIAPEDIVYIDETGCDQWLVLSHGWAKRGCKLVDFITGKSFKRLSIISAICNNVKLKPYLFTGTCTKNVFIDYLKTTLLPAIAGTHKVIVMDNAAFHKGTEIQELIEAEGHTLKFLPPYSPQLNPQETVWANLKTYLRTNLVRCGGQLRELILNFFGINH